MLTKKTILITQGCYYLITGLWPIVHLPSFVTITGPKDDYWLVKMVALLTMSAGITMLAAYKNSNASLVLNFTFALSYLIIDLTYTLNGTIRKVYLGDAIVELIFIALILLLHFNIPKKVSYPHRS